MIRTSAEREIEVGTSVIERFRHENSGYRSRPKALTGRRSNGTTRRYLTAIA
jgi:hypothetical protein